MNTKIYYLFILIIFLNVLSGCAVQIKDYQNSEEVFILEEYFDGEIDAWGMVENRQGKVTRRFNVKIQASWQDNVGTLIEDFIYDDGEEQQRIWTITKQENGNYLGTASDIEGNASGETAGFALNWRYQMKIQSGGTDWLIGFDDWMYQIDENVVINKAVLKKWGFRVGEVTLFFIKKIDNK